MRFSRLISSFFSFHLSAPIYFSEVFFPPLSATLPSMSSSLSTRVRLQDQLPCTTSMGLLLMLGLVGGARIDRYELV